MLKKLFGILIFLLLTKILYRKDISNLVVALRFYNGEPVAFRFQHIGCGHGAPIKLETTLSQRAPYIGHLDGLLV